MSCSMFGRALCVVAALCFCSTVTHADVVNINIFGVIDGTSSANYVGTAAAPDAGTVWNQYIVDNRNPSPPPLQVQVDPPVMGSLVDSTGLGTSLSFDLVGMSWGQDLPTHAGPASGNGMMDAFVLFHGTEGDGLPLPPSFVIGGLVPGAAYDLYLYTGYGDETTGSLTTSFTIGGDTKTATSNGFGGSFVLNEDYVKYSGVIASGVGTITGTTGAAGYGTFDGVQVVGIPEPSTLALLATGLLALLAYAWRKRK